MKVLVSGAGGYLGNKVVERLLERGHSVRAISRPASPERRWMSEVEVIRADLRVHEKLVPMFDGIDAVLHLAAATSGGEDVQFSSSVVATERFLEAMAQTSVKRLIHVSSFVVYDWARASSVMDEDTPLVNDIYDMGAYTIAKVWQERVVSKLTKANGWDLTIMRPGFIWGRGHAEIAGMGRHIGRTYLMFGPFTRLPLSHVVNCADCIVAALESPSSSGETFNVLDGDNVRVWRYVKEYSRRTGQRGLLLPIPYTIGFGLALLASFISRVLFGKKGKLPSLLMPRRFQSQFKPLRFSNKKLMQKMAWSPRLSFDECLRLTYESKK